MPAIGRRTISLHYVFLFFAWFLFGQVFAIDRLECPDLAEFEGAEAADDAGKPKRETIARLLFQFEAYTSYNDRHIEFVSVVICQARRFLAIFVLCFVVITYSPK